MEDGFRSGQRSTVAFALWLCMGGPIVAARFALRARLWPPREHTVLSYGSSTKQSVFSHIMSSSFLTPCVSLVHQPKVHTKSDNGFELSRGS